MTSSAEAKARLSSARLLYIVGDGHSGSSLLDVLLGATPDVPSTGEVHRLSLDSRARSCPCGRVVAECTSRTGRRSARRVGGRLLLDYLEHVRTVPSWRANANPDQIAWASNLAREGTPVYVTSPESHPQVLGELPELQRLSEKAP